MKIQQLLLDTVANLPELKILCVNILDPRAKAAELANFKPNPGLRYVEELTIHYKMHVLEKDGDRPVGYRMVY
jgi:hypothetical protein